MIILVLKKIIIIYLFKLFKNMKHLKIFKLYNIIFNQNYVIKFYKCLIYLNKNKNKKENYKYNN